jgi:hypothetical protein
MSGETKGWHASEWNTRSRPAVEAQLRLLQELQAGRDPYDRSHAYGWAQRDQIDQARQYAEQREQLQQFNQQRIEQQRNQLKQLNPQDQVGERGVPQVPQILRNQIHRPIPSRNANEAFRDTAQQAGFPSNLEIVEGQSNLRQVAYDLASHRSEKFGPYIESVFRQQGPYATCEVLNRINFEFLKIGAPFKFVTKFTGPNDSALVADLLDNRNGRSQGTYFLR